ncbi:unnamed protein product [Phytophthora fragariaefolia]|uniref:Unnamed protein product n=1 Tax=Phytophthora fragariaefolia TaxID=1490495 RepID=A0A9W6WZ17_9STRA|nr:unnamed protein product [Phytophthora fragariaefolia]
MATVAEIEPRAVARDQAEELGTITTGLGVDEEAGFDNLRVTRLDTGDSMLVHCCFLTSYHCPEAHLEEIARRETEAYDGDEQESNVWHYQEARTEVSSGNGNGVEIKEGSAVGVVGSDRRRYQRAPDQNRRLVEGQPVHHLRAKDHRRGRAGALLGAWYEFGRRPSDKNIQRQEAASMPRASTARTGRLKKQAATASFADVQVYGAITERGRRRRMNRAGRYELEYEIEYRTAAETPVQRRWLGIKEYEIPLNQGELEDELDGDGK